MRLEEIEEAMQPVGVDHALRLWRGMADGSWRIVQWWDVGGERVVVVRPGRPGDGAALRPREQETILLAALGHSNKVIGYELGVAPSTAAGILKKAQQKLGIGSRRELIELFGAAAASVSAFIT